MLRFRETSEPHTTAWHNRENPSGLFKFFLNLFGTKKLKTKFAGWKMPELSYRNEIVKQLGIAQLWNVPGMISVVVCSHFWSTNGKPRYN